MGNYCCCRLKSPQNQAKTTEDFVIEIEKLLERNKCWPTRRKRITHTYNIQNIRSDAVVEEDPTIVFQRWYYGKISRTEMFSLLTSQKMEAGTYLVRKPISVNDCPYVLSVVGRRESGKFFVKHVKIFSRNNRFYLKNGRDYGTVAELLESYKIIHEDMLRKACIKPDSHYKFDLDPISLMTDKGDVEIKRHVVYCPLTNDAVVELALDL